MSEQPEENSKPAKQQADDGRWDDCFAPPDEPCECWCMHCHRTFMSDKIWFQRIINSKDDMKGFWLCPTNNCDGKGFTFDIFPTDPDHPANDGWSDDDDYEEDDEEEFDGEFEQEFTDVPKGEWDPKEIEYAGDDDIEGEEWKFGVEAGGDLPEENWSEGRRQWEEEQKIYDAPDERPRVEDWSDRPEHPRSDFRDEDIPF